MSAVSAVAAAQAVHVEAVEAVEAVLANVRHLKDAAPSQFHPDFVAVVRHVYWQHLTVPSGELSVVAGVPIADRDDGGNWVGAVRGRLRRLRGGTAAYVEIVDAATPNMG
jgi:hypothetical protein